MNGDTEPRPFEQSSLYRYTRRAPSADGVVLVVEKDAVTLTWGWRIGIDGQVNGDHKTGYVSLAVARREGLRKFRRAVATIAAKYGAAVWEVMALP